VIAPLTPLIHASAVAQSRRNNVLRADEVDDDSNQSRESSKTVYDLDDIFYFAIAIALLPFWLAGWLAACLLALSLPYRDHVRVEALLLLLLMSVRRVVQWNVQWEFK
jgi:hypothetical protein